MNKTLILGLGGAGCNIVYDVFHAMQHPGKLPDADCILINTDKDSLDKKENIEKIYLEPVKHAYELKSLRRNEKLLYTGFLSCKEKLSSDVKQYSDIIMITGFGGFTGSNLTLMTLKLLDKNQRTSIYGTLPMVYEGQSKNFIAFNTIAKCYAKETENLQMNIQQFGSVTCGQNLFVDDMYTIMDISIKSMIMLQLSGSSDIF